jgi:hypothetical protein
LRGVDKHVGSLAGAGAALYSPRMTRIFDLDDHARLPWRFFGATQSVLARR